MQGKKQKKGGGLVTRLLLHSLSEKIITPQKRRIK